MTLPLIGLTGQRDENHRSFLLRQSYPDAVIRAGGVPMLLPRVPEEQIAALADRLDGLILTGGEDVNPLFFGHDPHPALGAVDTGRDQFELALARHWMKLGRPLLGICRGAQVIQVAAGGTLIQDLPSLWPHAICHCTQGPRSNPAHRVTVQPDTLLSDLLGMDGTLEVNSIHHQAVDVVAAGFRKVAAAGDGVIEAFESANGLPIIGVQWHPEEMTDAASNRLFAGFIALAREQAVRSGQKVPPVSAI